MSTSDDAALSRAGRHSDGRPAEPGLRVAFPRHLRDELPTPPPSSPDDRGAGDWADLTVPMPAIQIPRNRLNPKIWLSAAGVVIVMVTTTLLLTNRERTNPEPDAWAGPGPVVTQSPADDSSLLPEQSPGSPAPSATTRPGTPASSRPRGQLNTTGAVVIPVAPTTVDGQRPPTPTPTPSPRPGTPTPPAGPTPLPVTVRTNRPVVAANGLCLDNANANSSTGNPIQVYQCNTSAAQKFSHNTDGSLLVQGKCIKPVRSGTGSSVQLGTCDPSGQWYFRSDKVLVNKQSLLCLTVSANVVNGLRPTTMETCSGTAAQQWAFA